MVGSSGVPTHYFRHLYHRTKIVINASQTEGITTTGVNQKVLPVLSTETLLHIWLSTEYYGFRPSSTAVDTVN